MNLLRKYYNVSVVFLKGENVIYFLMLMALALRVHNFSSTSIWSDEGVTLELIHRSVKGIIKASFQDVNAPLYTVVGHFWALLFGYSLSTVRFLSVVCAALTVGVLFKTADKNFGRKAAIISTLLLCFSNIHIYYSEEARCYALLCLNASMALYYFFELTKHPGKKVFILYTFFSLLTIYTQFFFGLQIVVQFIILIIVHKKNIKALKLIAIHHVAIGFLFAVWFVPTFIYKSKIDLTSSWVPPLSVDNLNWYFRDLFNTDFIFYCIVVIYLIAASFALIKRKTMPHNYRSMTYSMILAILPFLAMCFTSYVIMPIVYPRFILFISIPLFISIGAVFSYFSVKSVAQVVLMILFINLANTTNVNAFRNQEWDKAHLIEKVFYKDSTCVMVSPSYSEFCYIYNVLDWAYFEKYDELGYYKWDHHFAGIDDSLTFISRKFDKFKRVIFFDGEPLRDDRMLIYLKNNYDSTFTYHFYGVDFYVYDRRHKLGIKDTGKVGIN